MSIQKPQLRSSSLPLFMSCGNAVMNPDKLLPVESDNEAAATGTHVHLLAETLVRTGNYDLEPLKQRLGREDYDRAGKLMRNFHAIWREAKKHMADPKTEVFLVAELPSLMLTGHIDLLSMDGKQAFVIDYKTGRQHEDHFHQMAGYAYLVWVKAGRPRAYTVNVSVAYLEDLSVHPYTFDVPALTRWEDEIEAQAMQRRYTVGRKCAGCPLRDSCPAYKQFMAGSASVFNDDTAVPQKSWEQMTPEQRGQLIDRMYVIEKAIDRAKLGLRNLVKQTGRVEIGDGKEMVLVQDTTKFLDTRRSLPVLRKRIPQAELDRIARLPLDEVLSAFAKRAAKGGKVKAREALLEELEAHGAVIRASSTKMWRRPAGEKVLKETENE